MDDDSYYEPDEKPRIQLAKGGPIHKIYSEGAKPSRTEKLISLAVSMALFAVAATTGSMFFGILQILAFWAAFSVALGPFAPLEYTGGDCRVGLGEPLPEETVDSDEPPEDSVKPKSKSRGGLKRVASGAEVVSADEFGAGPGGAPSLPLTGGATGSAKEGGDWSNEELEAFRKLMVKYPKGTAKRWEAIASGLGTSRSTEEVVKMSKVLGEKKPTNTDAYSAFLSQRKEKPIASAPSTRDVDVGDTVNWSPEDDQTLVRALKEFPKDTSARWEKVSAAVPNKTKTQCFKRFGELRDSFRNAKMGGDEGGESLE
eukprot:TRINITY_DN2547_c0_g1_i1.p1 TRINITY_DN2547_c0_g1~~TRINITY_DN2547_c0_g1_i1.p1  ORF type:complete len:331 (+),score=71.27 TRINITY_DN2547_c0_g1_i1:53-994(+)